MSENKSTTVPSPEAETVICENNTSKNAAEMQKDEPKCGKQLKKYVSPTVEAVKCVK